MKIKKFLGRSENAVRIQILTALISYLLVAIYKQSHAIKAQLVGLLVPGPRDDNVKKIIPDSNARARG